MTCEFLARGTMLVGRVTRPRPCRVAASASRRHPRHRRRAEPPRPRRHLAEIGRLETRITLCRRPRTPAPNLNAMPRSVRRCGDARIGSAPHEVGIEAPALSVIASRRWSPARRMRRHFIIRAVVSEAALRHSCTIRSVSPAIAETTTATCSALRRASPGRRLADALDLRHRRAPIHHDPRPGLG